MTSVAQLRNIPVEGLEFQREVSRTSEERTFESMIRSGSLVLTDVGRTVDVQEGQDLRLEGVTGHVSVVIDKSVALVFAGTARHVRVGFFNAVRDEMPSWLEWFYYLLTHHVLALVLLSTWLALWRLWQLRKKLPGLIG
jgi:hypothetical protein